MRGRTSLLCPYAGWYMWRGISGLVYARRLHSSPPVIFRAATEDAVLDMIAEWTERHQPRLPGQQ